MFLANIDQGFAKTVTILGTTTPEGKKDNRALSAVDESYHFLVSLLIILKSVIEAIASDRPFERPVRIYVS